MHIVKRQDRRLALKSAIAAGTVQGIWASHRRDATRFTARYLTRREWRKGTKA